MLQQLFPAIGLTLVVAARRIEVPDFDSDVVIYPKGVHCQAWFKNEYGDRSAVDDFFYAGCNICPNGKGGDVDRAWEARCDSYNDWEFEVEMSGRCNVLGTPDGWNIMEDWGCQAWCRTTPKWDYGCGCGNGTDCLDVDCEMSAWSDWSDCVHYDKETQKTVTIDCDAHAALVNGYHTRTRTVKVEKEYGGADCPATTEKRSCDSHSCVDVDCKVSAWTAWSECSKSCGGGKKHRYRKVTRQPQDNGAACPALSQTKSCNTDYCYYFKLKGKSANSGEQVRVIDGEVKSPTNNDGVLYTLSNQWTTIGTNSYIVTIWYKNDNGTGRDVTFKYATSPSGEQSGGFQPTILSSDKWNCGKENENSRCERVRKGYFQWKGAYKIVFLAKKI